jgi:2-methylisocitrate lyase-like PEP mutase family enzyme
MKSTDTNKPASQVERAAALRKLHQQRPLILPNAWDAGSARLIELAGAAAIATTSAGVSWTFGRSDGQKLQRAEMLEVIRSIVQAVRVPVTADIEGGYGEGLPRDITETVREVVALGVAGINLEDSPGRGDQILLEADEQAERIRAARNTAMADGGDLVINARTDVYLFEVGEAHTRFDEVVRRGKIYHAGGADCIFVPGVIDAATIATLVKAIDLPLNVMAMPGAPSVPELAKLGVARVSVGPAIALAALGATRRAAMELLGIGTYTELERGLPFPEANGMFADLKT